MATAAPEIKPDFAPRKRHFCFTDEHEALRESIESFASKELAPHSEEWERDGFPDSVFKRMGELGFLGIYFPEEYGGQGGDYLMSIVRGEAMAQANNGGLVMGDRGPHRHGDSADPQVRLGVPEADATSCPRSRARRSPRSASPSPAPGSDVAGIRTRAVRDGDEYVINGSKTFITNGARADFIVLVTKTDPDAGYDGFSLFVVDKDSPGFHVSRKLEKLGMHSSDTAELTFEDVRVPAENLLGEEGKGFYHIMWELQGERLIGAAGCVAGAQRVFDQTLEYAQGAQRLRPADRPLPGDPAQVRRDGDQDRDRAADGLHDRMARAEGDYPVREISMAKLYASRIACEVCDEAIQIHGGYGYMKEYHVERAWRDMRLNRIGAGHRRDHARGDRALVRALSRPWR